MRKLSSPTAIVLCLLVCSKITFGQINKKIISPPLLVTQPIFGDSSLKSQKANKIFNSALSKVDPKRFVLNFQNIVPIKAPVSFKSKIFVWKNASLNFGITDNVVSAENGYGNVYSYSNSTASIAFLAAPFSIGYNSNSGWQNSRSLKFAKIQLNREQLLEQVKEKIKKSYEPEELLQSFMASIYSKRDQAISSIRNDLQNVLKAGDEKLSKSFLARTNSENISRIGLDQFINNLLQETSQSLGERERLLLKVKDQFSNENKTDSLAYIISEIRKQNQLKEQKQNQILELRSKWFKSGILEVLNSFEKQKQDTINKLLNNPEVISKIAAQKLNLTSLQKLLLNAKTLNIGSSSINQSNLNIHNALFKGLNLEFLKNQKYFAPIAGLQPGIKNIMDFSYSNFRNLPNILTGGLSFGKGAMQDNFSKVTLMMYQANNNQQLLPGNLQVGLPRNLVTTFTKRIVLGDEQYLQTEISKSTYLYNQGYNSSNGVTKSLMNNSDFFGNMGVNLNYSGEFKKLGLSNNISLGYTGKEYENLGNSNLSSGTKALNNDIKKYFFKDKLIINGKVSFREYDFSLDNRKWRSLSYVADVKFKMNKGEFVELRYQPYFNHRIEGKEKYLNSASNRVAIRANINRKVLKGVTYRNYIEISSTQDQFRDLQLNSLTRNHSVSFTSLQTLMLGKQSAFLNFTGSHANQNLGYLFSSSYCSLDGGLSYISNRNIAMSSSIAYNSVHGLYNQLAIRQSINTLIGKRISVGCFVSIGKNFQKQSYINIPTISGNASISYLLK